MNLRGVKFDEGKADYTLLPWKALERIQEVLDYGAKKYEPHGWREVEDGCHRYQAAALRHLFSFMRGERVDPESDLSHLSHAAVNLMFVIELLQEEPQNG